MVIAWSQLNSVSYLDAATITAISTIVIAVATLAYVIATYALWSQTRNSVNIMRETFEHSVMPVVAVPEVSPLNNTDSKELTFTVSVENYGSVPAVEVRTQAQIIADGVALNVQKHETGFLLIVPHSHIITTFFLDGDNYERAVRSARIDFKFSAQYEGVAEKKYQYDYEGVYYPSKREFISTTAKLTNLPHEPSAKSRF
jgi:hypothetical protein